MRAKVFVPAAVVLGALGVGGLILYSPNHSACSSILVQATNGSLCRTVSTMDIISWALIAVAILITLGQIASLTQSRNSNSNGGHTPSIDAKSTPGSLGIDTPRNVYATERMVNRANEVGPAAKVGRPTEIELTTALEKLDRDELTDEEWGELTSADETESSGRRRSTVARALVIGLIVVVLIVAAGVVVSTIKNRNNGSAPANASTPSTSQSSGLISESLPLYICHTTYGISGTKAASLPANFNEMVPPGTVGKLVIYTDAQGVMKLLGPPGWGCTAGIGADGSSVVTIAPMNSSIWNTTDYSGTLSADSTVEEINGIQNGACNGCGLTQACPVFTTAWYKYHNSGSACPTTAPSSEITDQLTKNVIGFSDPPGVHGDANPSGGAYTARGVMTYFANQFISSSMETCVMPNNEQSLCSATLSNFALNYGSK